MSSVTVCIIDDEFRARRRIAELLSQEDGYEVVGEADNGADAVELIDRVKPDLIFLDIRMPGLSGFQVLQEAQHKPAVIFVTAYDEHAVQAFDVHAVDYLLKPFPDGRFREALERVGEKRGVAEPDVLERLEMMIRDSRESMLERIPVRRGFEFDMVPVASVDCFTIADGLVFLVQGKRRVVVDHTLRELEERLDPSMFMRVHRNSLVNVNGIIRVVPWGRGRIALHFTEGEPVHVGRDRTQAVKQRIGIS
ncbi:MAG: LytTR family DNA-binding domain-containing protein [Alkalispirochaeta sp.]